MGDYQDRVAKIVQRILYVTVATCSAEGQPWNSPTYSAFDNDGNFYWVSSPEAQHSRNVSANGRAFLAIYDSTVSEGTGEGVYIGAEVQVLETVEEISFALNQLSSRVQKPEDDSPESFLAGGVRRVYRASPLRAWTNVDETDERGKFIRDVRVEVPLEDLRRLVNW